MSIDGISFIIPNWNEELVLPRSIRSALLAVDHLRGQGVPAEVIVIDDGSTDTTLLAAKEHETKHKMRVIHQKNQGKAEALNRGLAEAMGEFILSVDADGIAADDRAAEEAEHPGYFRG